ncbi:hypothetical protein [Marinomonas epiphytica]
MQIQRASKNKFKQYRLKRELSDPLLDELPEEDLVWEGRADEGEAEKKERGKASLSALKAMLNG